MGGVTVFSLLASIILSIFTVRADRIYTICYKDENVCYVYSQDNQVYEWTEGDVLIPLGDSVPIERQPALSYIEREDVIEAFLVTTNCYAMSFRSTCSFLTKMVQDGYTLSISLQTPTTLEGCLISENDTFRFVYRNDDTFRIYAKDYVNFSGSYPYLSQDGY